MEQTISSRVKTNHSIRSACSVHSNTCLNEVVNFMFAPIVRSSLTCMKDECKIFRLRKIFVLGSRIITQTRYIINSYTMWWRLENAPHPSLHVFILHLHVNMEWCGSFATTWWNSDGPSLGYNFSLPHRLNLPGRYGVEFSFYCPCQTGAQPHS